VIGQILHPQFFSEKTKGTIEWKTPKKHVFVSCGSQGSRKIFRTLLDQKKNFPDTEWIISLGTLNGNMRAEFEQWEDTQVFDWINQSDIPQILDGTEIAITRASATTLAELVTRPIHLLIIPLAISAGNHQLYNARVYEKNGHTIILEENLSTTDIGSLMGDAVSTSDINTQENSLQLLIDICTL
jgi:UDP-N-acetylglucosamine--N-acetylmuramyl-(pentapeptide) pyrophosphoryl-undecaprenol N-acetylglucosamine transferase